MDTTDLEMVGERYRLLRRLGEGGMASVWVAADLERDGEVAIKFLSAECAASAMIRARFEREAVALQQLTGPGVVKVHSHGVDQHGRPHIVMELLDGEDLQGRLSREHRLSLAATAALVTEVAAALQRAHAAGIVHRDLKPANVFFARAADGERVKLLDFGIAKIKRADSARDEGATRTGQVFGTVTYMSPEQMKGSRDVDHRTDVWSLGVIAFRAMTGRLPFRGHDYPELFPKICYDPIPVASEIAPDLLLSAEIDRFFLRALERDRPRRFQTALDLAAELDRIVHARPSTEVARTTLLGAPTELPVPPSAPGETRPPSEPVPSAAPRADLLEPVAPGESSTVKRGEQSTGGLTMQPTTGAEPRPGGAPIGAPAWLVTLTAGIVVGTLVAVLFTWRETPAVQPVATAAPAPVPTAPDTNAPEPTAASVTASALVPTAAPTTAPVPTMAPTTAPAGSPAAPPTTSPSPPGVPTTHPVAPPPGSAPHPGPLPAREKDPYCRAAYPDTPYVSPAARPGCVESGAGFCCP